MTKAELMVLLQGVGDDQEVMLLVGDEQMPIAAVSQWEEPTPYVTLSNDERHVTPFQNAQLEAHFKDQFVFLRKGNFFDDVEKLEVGDYVFYPGGMPVLVSSDNYKELADEIWGLSDE